ncbi:MAG: sigma-70 family RNA polymerase sigma factor [Myxococcota bacterium]
MDPELELLRSWQGGDDRAGNQLFERHFDAIYRFFYGKVEDALAEELAQDTFLSVVQHRDGLHEHRSVRAYLFAVARNKLYDLLRRRGRAARPVDLSECSLEDLGPTPTGLLSRQRQERILLQALRGLPVELQVLMELRYFEGLRGPQLAETLEVPEGTVRSRLRRAHRLLRERLERLADSSEQVESTMSGLEDWARVVRERVEVG